MRSHGRLVFCLLFFGPSIIPVAAQNTGAEFRPELGFYVQQGPLIRLEFIDSATGNQATSDWQGRFEYYIQLALKPVFRRELRNNPDVYRNKYLTMRVGYRYQTNLTNGNSSTTNEAILEFTSRYLLPRGLVVSDRNRGEFRFPTGQPFYTRYRNRLRLERDIIYRWLNCTPYAYAEIFYDARYDQWTPNRYAAGLQFPAGPHMVLEPYYLRQNGSHSNPPHINALGFKWNLYF
jgi:hypothetical protein